MKKLILTCLLAAGSWCLVAAQDMCEALATLKKGTELEYSQFNKKNKFQGKHVMKVLDRKTQGGKVSSQIEATFYDKKGKKTSAHTYEMTCENNTLYMDLRNLLDPAMYESMSSLDIEWSGIPTSYSAKMKVGDKLPDANIELKAKSGGVSLMNMTIDIVDQEVMAKEKLDTPAGKFDTFKVSSNIEVKAIIKRTMPSMVWFSPDVGTVRSDSYDRKGNLSSYTLLTALRR